MVLIGTYASTLNMTVIGVVLPDVARDLGRAGGNVDWVVTGFLVGMVLALPLTGWLSDRVGRRNIYVASLLVFSVGAAASALSPSLELLVAARVLQGLGGGAVIPMGMAIVFDLFPADRRGMALGVWGVATMAGPAAGPPVGGWMVGVASWRGVLGVFAAIALVAGVLGRRLLPDVGHREQRPLDVAGWVVAAAAVTTVIVGLRQAAPWGISSPPTVSMVLAGLLLAVFLVRRSLSRADPLIEFRMFTVPAYSAAMAITALLSVAQFAQFTFLPLELQVVRGLDAWHVGLLLAPSALGTAAMMPIAGWLVDRIGAKGPVAVGLAIMGWTMWRLGHLTPEVSEAEVVLTLVIQGVGLGFVFIPSSVAAMSSVAGRFVAQASAMSNLCRQMGGAAGVAALTAVVVSDLGAVAPANVEVAQAQAAYNRVFMATFWCFAIGVVLALQLPGRKAMRALQAERAAEQAA